MWLRASHHWLRCLWKTLEEAHQNISSAIKECLEVIHQFNKDTPKETMEPKEVRKFSFVKVRQREYAKT